VVEAAQGERDAIPILRIERRPTMVTSGPPHIKRHADGDARQGRRLWLNQTSTRVSDAGSTRMTRGGVVSAARASAAVIVPSISATNAARS
jgi:hypothetical protein